jgi:FMN-dependent NADH-azoreductase
MSKILFVASSIQGTDSKSRRLGREVIDLWQRHHPGPEVIERDLAAEPLPHVTREIMAAALTPAAERTLEQAKAAALADRVIEEAEAADLILLAVPMYNFSVPSTLKAWIDHLARAGRTFRYGENGPVGLLTGKKVIVVSSRGGIYSRGAGRALDFHEPYLRGVLGFLGLTDVSFVHAEGLNIGSAEAERALDEARTAIATLLPGRAAA